MPGHLWKVTDIDQNVYHVVTKRRFEESARAVFHAELGHRIKVLHLQYVSFVDAVQG